MQNETCFYSSKENAPDGILCGNLVSQIGKFAGQIRKTGADEFTVYGPTGIVGKFAKSAFRFVGRDFYTAKKFTNEYALN